MIDRSSYGVLDASALCFLPPQTNYSILMEEVGPGGPGYIDDEED